MLREPLKFKPNTLYRGDCLDVMDSWNDGCVDLIYLDPPFNSNSNYNIIYGKDRAGKPLDEPMQFFAFKDTWFWNEEAKQRVQEISRAVGHPAHLAIKGLAEMLPETGMLAYLSYMAQRLAVMHRILKDTGSIYLHCDPTASHYLKTVMDCVFEVKNFRNEVVWSYRRWSGKTTAYQKMHDTIFFYVKDKNQHTWNQPMEPKLPSSKPYKSTKAVDDRGMVINVIDKSVSVPDTAMRDVWEIGRMGPRSKERLKYPTQKPIAVLERIIKASSNEGDIVLDPFCGCGTTAEATYKLGRQLIGIDISPYAIRRICHDRLKDAAGLTIEGFPTDIYSAREMADDRFLFEQWAVTTLPGFEPNDKQVGDGGVDGRGMMLNPPGDKGGGKCVVQVKSGGCTPNSMRAFLSQITGHYASMGIFITMDKMNDTKTKRECIANAGQFTEGAKTFNRMMFWSIEEHFEAKNHLQLPAMAHPRTGKEMPPESIAMD